MKQCQVFVEHVNLEQNGSKLVRHDFNTIRGAIKYVRSNGASRVGQVIQAKTSKGVDKIATYKGNNGNYFLTRRFYK